MAVAGLVAARPKCLALALPNAVDAIPGSLPRSPLSECSRETIGSITIYVLESKTSSPDTFDADLKP